MHTNTQGNSTNAVVEFKVGFVKIDGEIFDTEGNETEQMKQIKRNLVRQYFDVFAIGVGDTEQAHNIGGIPGYSQFVRELGILFVQEGKHKLERFGEVEPNIGGNQTYLRLYLAHYAKAKKLVEITFANENDLGALSQTTETESNLYQILMGWGNSITSYEGLEGNRRWKIFDENNGFRYYSSLSKKAYEKHHYFGGETVGDFGAISCTLSY